LADESPARHCFGCGSANERGLRMQFRLEDGRAVAEFAPEQFLQGFPGRMHGGGVMTMLDEAMGWAAYAAGAWAMTARLTARFRAAVPLDEPLAVSGWVTRERGRTLELRSEVRSQDGVLLAEAEGLFAKVSGRQAEELARLYQATPT
jgi:acyl-coenzyme A thioesterase PaaI-like protein